MYKCCIVSMASTVGGGFKIDSSGGDGYRKLNIEEKLDLKKRLEEICEQETKISPSDIVMRKSKASAHSLTCRPCI